MAQIETVSWTNPNPAVAKDINLGFSPAEATVVDITNGGSWQWVYGMSNASYLDVDAGTITNSNGFTPLAQDAAYGATITGFTNANPGVITASGVTAAGIVAGDTITVGNLADNEAGTSLNNTYTVASVTATTITTTTDTSAYSVYVSGGVAVRVKDSSNSPAPTVNIAVRGMHLGTGCVGAASANMVAIFKSQEPVC
jgi:hypothetical protein